MNHSKPYLNRLRIALVGLAAALVSSAFVFAQSPEAFDVIIKNGHILDGTGSPWYAADIGIRGDRTAAIGKLDSASAPKIIDARGQIVSPGFIDMLGQSEWSLLIDNRSLSKLSQGITTEITGEGGSIAPQDPKNSPLDPALPRSLSPHLGLDHSRRLLCASREKRHSDQSRHLRRCRASSRSRDRR